jgi:hypothetical protein
MGLCPVGGLRLGAAATGTAPLIVGALSLVLSGCAGAADFGLLRLLADTEALRVLAVLF